MLFELVCTVRVWLSVYCMLQICSPNSQKHAIKRMPRCTRRNTPQPHPTPPPPPLRPPILAVRRPAPELPRHPNTARNGTANCRRRWIVPLDRSLPLAPASLLHLAQPPTDLDHELIDLRNLRRPLRRARRASDLASDLALELGPALLLPEYLEVRLGKG